MYAFTIQQYFTDIIGLQLLYIILSVFTIKAINFIFNVLILFNINLLSKLQIVYARRNIAVFIKG